MSWLGRKLDLEEDLEIVRRQVCWESYITLLPCP